MCLYCKTLQKLRFDDLRQFERSKAKFWKWYKEDVLLLRRCLIALDWKNNQELVNDILKRTEGGDEA